MQHISFKNAIAASRYLEDGEDLALPLVKEAKFIFLLIYLLLSPVFRHVAYFIIFYKNRSFTFDQFVGTLGVIFVTAFSFKMVFRESCFTVEST